MATYSLKATGSSRGDLSIIQRQDPAAKKKVVTKSDTDDYTGVRGFLVTTAGDINIQLEGDDAPEVVAAVPAGFYPWAVKKIMSTNTTASGFTLFG